MTLVAMTCDPSYRGGPSCGVIEIHWEGIVHKGLEGMHAELWCSYSDPPPRSLSAVPSSDLTDRLETGGMGAWVS
jgi:hypothetical protein